MSTAEKFPGQGPINLITVKDQKRIEKEKDLQERKEDDIKALMKIAAFRRFSNEFLEISKAFEDITVYGDQGYTTMNLAGQKKMGLWYLARIMGPCPDQFVQMRKEFRDEQIQIEKELNKPE